MPIFFSWLFRYVNTRPSHKQASTIRMVWMSPCYSYTKHWFRNYQTNSLNIQREKLEYLTVKNWSKVYVIKACKLSISSFIKSASSTVVHPTQEKFFREISPEKKKRKKEVKPSCLVLVWLKSFISTRHQIISHMLLNT